MPAKTKCPPSFLKALGSRGLPESVQLERGSFVLVSIFKHDFFAATALYRSGDGELAVIKFGRQNPVLGFPLDWLGRFLVNREARIYQTLHGMSGIPDYWGQPSPWFFAHKFIPGEPLHASSSVSDAFFEQLQSILHAIHARGMAYVDLEKRENIIVGADGRPYLIDFQISWHFPNAWRILSQPLNRIRRVLQEMDEYHLLKHRRRQRPDQLTTEELEESFRLPIHIRWHRRLVAPLQKIRRSILNRLDPGHATARR